MRTISTIFILFFCQMSIFSIEKDDVLIKSIQQIAEGNNEFAFNIYRESKNDEKNYFFSPFSISTAFSMVYVGSNGSTTKEIKEVLRFPFEPEKLYTTFGQLQHHFSTGGYNPDRLILPANALWIQAGFPLNPDFMKVIAKGFKPYVKRVDFSNDLELARSEINRWVQENTNGRISNIIKPGFLSSSTQLALISAIYFKSRWEKLFDKELTRLAPFFPTSEKSILVPTMENTGPFKYFKHNSFSMIELPYVKSKSENVELTMLILLPERREKVRKIMDLLTVESLKNWIENSQLERIQLFLPKFKISADTDLKGALENMGMQVAFSEKADFSKISNKKLMLGQAVHKTFINVDENGTEAAAATAVSVNLTAVQTKSTVFKADHPFVFIIMDKVSGTILFIGHVHMPEAS